MDQKGTLRKIRMARTYCAEQLPWFAPMLYACRIRLTAEVPVAAVSEDLRVFFNARAVEELWAATNGPQDALRQLGFIWAHEVAHVLRDHAGRARAIGAAPSLWNLAADLEINDAEWPGLEPPVIFEPCVPQQFFLPEGLLAEQYYKRLKDREMEEEANDMNDEGSGVHGQSASWEKQNGDEAFVQADTPNPGEEEAAVNKLEVGLLRQQSELMLDRALERGELPGELERWVAQGKNSKIDWRKILAKRIRQGRTKWEAGRHDYSRRRPHRRQHVQAPFSLPALDGRPVPMSIACVVDTSGSIGAGLLSQIFAEVKKIMETLNCETLVIPCDASAYTPIPLRNSAELQNITQLQGGGGTNMVVGVEAALALKPAPAMVIVFTDGYTPYPQQRYATPVLWALVEDEYGPAPGPPQEVWPEEWVVRVYG